MALQDNPLALGKNITECASTAMMANVGIRRVASGHSEFSALFLLSSPHLNTAWELIAPELSSDRR